MATPHPLPLDAEDQVFEDLDLTGQRLERRSLVGCTLRRCKLSGARLERWTLDEVRFEDCDLSVIKWGESALCDVEFVDCKLTGINWAEAHALTLAVRFERSTLDYGSFLDVPLKRLRVTGGTANDVTWADCDLRNATFDGVTLADASFLRCDLRGANFGNCEGISLDASCRLGKTKISLADALAHLHQMGLSVEMG